MSATAPASPEAVSPAAAPQSDIPSQPWDVVVIGAGIGGLVTASQLAAKGARVLVLERYLIPGGSGGSFRREGYTFDVGASMIFGFGQKGHTNLLTRALADVGEACETIADPAQLEYHLPAGLHLAVDRDYDSFVARLSALFPHEAKGIRAFYDTCWSVFNCLDAMPLLSLEDPAYLAKVFFRAPLACLGLARWLPVNVGDVARKHIQDPALLKFIDMECFCWSVMPADLTPMINAGMVFSDRHAVGVRLADGEEIRARRVVSNATRWDTFGGLIEEQDSPAQERTWRRRYKPSPSFLSLHLGVEASLIPAGTHCHHLLLEDWKAMEDEQGVVFVSMPSLLDPSLAPPDRHIVHAFTPSSMEAWSGLGPTDYATKKQADADRLISRLEAILPGLGAAIRHRDVGTPRSHRRFLGRSGGS